MKGLHEVDEFTEWMRGLGLPAAFLLANGLLLAPGWILRGAPGPPWLAGEALLAVTVFLLLPARHGTGFGAGLVAVLIGAFSLLLLGDAAARASLSRPLNLYLDWHLLGAVWNLTTGAVGGVLAGLVLTLVLGLAGAMVWGIARLLAGGRIREGYSVRRMVAAASIVSLVLVLGTWGELSSALSGGERQASDPPWPALERVLAWPGVALAADQARRVDALLEERARFSRELEETPASHAHVPDLLARLGGRNTVLAFIESYGMTVLEDPRYSRVLRPRLEELGRRMEDAGLALASGSLEAPTQGGQSWFSHASLLSGLWLDNQLKYDILLTSERETLVDDFSRAGYETTVLMPAITLAWPEGAWFGYDHIYAFDDIDYAGPPLNWVTMPDQFTWSFLQERILSGRTPGRSGVGGAQEDRPVFAEVGLISSHAPWTPILPVLSDWGSIGNGSVFEAWEGAGERPEELWRDTERVREHFALSVEYAVHAMTAYAERYVGDDVLLIVMGDHQPAPLITGEDASRAVPVHVISGAPELLGPFLEWGFRKGPFPDPKIPPRRMDEFRGWFVDAFSGSSGSGREDRGGDGVREEFDAPTEEARSGAGRTASGGAGPAGTGGR